MDNMAFNQSFFKNLEASIAQMSPEEQGKQFRPCAEECARGFVLREMRRQFEERGGDLDRQYARYGKSEYFFADIVEGGRVYEMGYPRLLDNLQFDDAEAWSRSSS